MTQPIHDDEHDCANCDNPGCDCGEEADFCEFCEDCQYAEDNEDVDMDIFAGGIVT
jgi:hypothetical protein